MRIFLSYSVNAEDYGLVAQIANLLWQRGLDVLVPEWHPRYGRSVSRMTASQIEASDLVLVLVTHPIARSIATQMETEFAIEKGRPVLALVEQGLNVEHFLSGIQRIEFNRWDFADATENVADYLRQLRDDQEQNGAAERRMAVGLALGGLLLWLLSQGGRGRE